MSAKTLRGFDGTNFGMRSITATIVVMFLWAVCFPLIVLGLPYAPHLTFAALRGFIAGLALLLVAMLLHRPQPRGLGTWLMLGGIGLGATTLGFFGMFHASEFVSPGIATVVANAQPLMAAILAMVVLGERLGWVAKTGLLLGFLGIVLIALPDVGASDKAFIGYLYLILSAAGITVSNVLISRIADLVDALTAMGWQLVLGSLFLLALAFATEEPFAVSWELPFVLSLLGLALPGTALAYWLWCLVLSRTELSRANVFSFLVPLFGLAMGVAFYQESVSGLTILGIGATLLGIFLVNRPRRESGNG